MSVILEIGYLADILYYLLSLADSHLTMKILFPRHIKKWIFASMNFTVGPLTVWLGQLFILVLGIAGSFWVANYFLKQGQSKMVAIMLSSPLTLIACAIAFFEISEMWLLEFIAKTLRTHFFDSTTKFQVNVEKSGEIDLLIKKIHTEEQIQKITFKTEKWLLSDEEESKVRESGLL
jgi:hypothetical protein